MLRLPMINIAVVLGVSACSNQGPVDAQADKAAAKLPDPEASAPTATGEPHGAPTKVSTALPAASIDIPTAIQGRWALTPADCTSTRGDAKGLLIISADSLKFYESRAVPAKDVSATEHSIGGTFAFTGEGQSWTKYEALKVNRNSLIRTEINPAASFAYAKCDS